VTTHINKVHHVTTITQVAKDLGEDEDWLWDIAIEMEIEDGVIWINGVGVELGLGQSSERQLTPLIIAQPCEHNVHNVT
jgi:hypothetical protein